MTKNLSKSVNILISELIALAAVFYFGQVFVIQQKRVGMVSSDNLRRSTNFFGRNHPKLCFWLRREGRQMPNTEQLSYQTDKSSHTEGVLKNKKLVSKISLNSEENNFVAWNSIKKRLQHICFPVAKFLGDTYFVEHMRMAASGLTLRSGCLELCFFTVAFKTILTQ